MPTASDDATFRELQRHLDRMPVPFPATSSGVEIRILKLLFTPEEARLALYLSAIPEPIETILRRAPAGDRDALRAALERLAEKGSILKLPGQGEPRFGKSPLAIGIYEAQVDRLTPELEREFRAYLDEGFGAALDANRTHQTRIVPVNKAIAVDRTVASYNDIRAFVQSSAGPFAAIHCICRQGKDFTGEPCRQTHERRNCLMFGDTAAHLIAKGVAHELTREAMLALLDRADSEGLVLEPQNTQNPMFVCCCCGCCCGVLTTARKMPSPADFFNAAFTAIVDRETCIVCGTCESRCHMDAIASGDEPARVDAVRCIGCGLCVTTCPTGAMTLEERTDRKPPPKDVRALYSAMFQARFGRMAAAAALAGHLVGRAV